MRKNTVEWDRPPMTIWSVCMVCWITKPTNTYLEYVILIAFPLQQWLRERSSLLRYMYMQTPRPLYPNNTFFLDSVLLAEGSTLDPCNMFRRPELDARKVRRYLLPTVSRGHPNLCNGQATISPTVSLNHGV